VPAIAISAWVPERTVIDGEYRNTSVLQTVRRRWELGPPLTARDAAAPDIVPVLSLDRPRPPEEWPDVVPQPVPAFQPQLLPRDAKLAALPRAALFAVLASDEDVLRVDGLAIITEIFGDMFPHLHGE
jgi:phospholipase C